MVKLIILYMANVIQVLLADGTPVRSSVVLSNATPYKTYMVFYWHYWFILNLLKAYTTDVVIMRKVFRLNFLSPLFCLDFIVIIGFAHVTGFSA